MMTVEPQDTYPDLNQAEEQQMKEFDITREPIDYFLFGEYRYTNLKDAVAEAKRKRGLR